MSNDGAENERKGVNLLFKHWYRSAAFFLMRIRLNRKKNAVIYLIEIGCDHLLDMGPLVKREKWHKFTF